MRGKSLRSGWLLLLLLGMVAGLLTCGNRAPWQEPFNEVGNWQFSSDAAAKLTIADGELRIHIRQPGQVAWAAASRTYRDFRLTVNATQVAGPDDNEYGILVRMDKNKSFYAFSISGDGYVRAARYANNAWTLLGSDWTPSAAIHQGAATNALTLEAEGTTFTFFVNGTQVLQVEDATTLKGDLGLYAGAFGEGGVIIAFDNLEVEPLP